MKIEVLFPEFANLFGDCWNWRYLARCMPQAELIETGYGDEPSFVSEKGDRIIMGAMTEHGQELGIKKLLRYGDRLRQLMGSGVVFLMTANAGEVFCEYIENEDGSRIAGLGLVPLHAKRDMMHRFNSTQLCAFEDMELVGIETDEPHILKRAQLRGIESVHHIALCVQRTTAEAGNTAAALAFSILTETLARLCRPEQHNA